MRVEVFGFWVFGFGFRVSGFGFRFSGVGCRVSGFESRVWDFGFWVSGFGLQISNFGFQASGFGARRAYRDGGPHEAQRNGDPTQVLASEKCSFSSAAVASEREKGARPPPGAPPALV